jgi:PAS domain S-box-containing protein
MSEKPILKKTDKKSPRGNVEATNKILSKLVVDEQPLGSKVRNIIDSLPFYVILIDRNHNIIEANSAVFEQLGIKREEIIGQYCPKVIHGVDGTFPGCPLEEAVTTNKTVEKELFDKGSGRWLVSAIYTTKLLSNEGEKIYLHVVHDITDRKLAQEQLKESHKQLRQLSAHLEYVREQEKKHIARELHDDTSQLLSSLSAHIESAIGNLPPRALKSKEIMRKTQLISNMILDEIHKLIYDLRPVTLDSLGLIAAVNSLIDSHLRIDGLKIDYQIKGEIQRMPPDREIVLYRLIQEAINNILRHSKATNVKILLEFKKQSIKVLIKDNGVGFDLPKILRYSKLPHAWGLLGMRERVDLLNGKLDIEAKPGKGTLIGIEVPYKAEEEDGQD